MMLVWLQLGTAFMAVVGMAGATLALLKFIKSIKELTEASRLLTEERARLRKLIEEISKDPSKFTIMSVEEVREKGLTDGVRIY